MWIIAVGSAGASYGSLGLLGGRPVAHADDAVDLTALVHEQALARDVTMHHASGLDLHPLAGHDGAAHLAADDRFARDHIALHFPALCDEHLPAGAHGTDHRAFDLHHAFGRNVPHDTHPRSNDRQRGLGFRRAVSLLGEDGHFISPLSP